MTSAKKFLGFRAALSLVLAATMVLGLFAGIITPANAAVTTDDNGLLTFTDDFNRESLTGDDSGWLAQKTEDSANYEIIDGVLNLTDASNENIRGYANGLVMRPISEAAVNQKASVEVNNVSDLTGATSGSANLHLRLLGTETKMLNFAVNGKTDSEDWANMSYYASVDNQKLEIRKTEVRYNTTISKWDRITTTLTSETFNVTDAVYKLVFTAKGTNPTVLKATLYDTATNAVVAEASCTDSTAALQQAGTAALSSCGGGTGLTNDRQTAFFDNFEYEQLSYDKAYYYDDFNRTTGISGDNSGWVEQISGQNKIGALDGETDPFDGVLRVVHTGTYGYSQNVVMRPMSEAAINQKASVTFSNMGHFYNDSSSYANVHLRVTDTSATNITSYLASANANYLKIYICDANGKLSEKAISDKWNLSGNVSYKLEFEATGTYPTTLTARLYNTTANTLVGEISYTDTTEALQRPGTTGVSITCNGAGHSRNSKFENFYYEYSDNVYFDDFERTTGIAGDNSGWIEQGVVAGNVASGTNFIGNTGAETAYAGMLRMKSTGWGVYTKNVLLRPMSEAAIDQQASVSEAAMGHAGWYGNGSKATINVHLRATSTDSANVTSYFAAFGQGATSGGVTPGHLTIYRSDSNGKVTPIDSETIDTNISGSIKYRLTLKAEGTYPTVLTATVYDPVNKVVKGTVTAVDSTDELQTAGTAGVSIQGADRTSKFDNFLYEYSEATDTVIIGDVDLDGDCDNDDVTAIRKHIIGADTAEGDYDINFDGNVDILDLVLAQRAAQGETGGTALDNTFYKLTVEKELNVAFFGGSITAGTGASDSSKCYRALTTQWLRDRFPEADIYETNAAIGGTGSAFGAYRAVRDLKLEDEAKKPDLVFIEFGVNDWLDTDADLKESDTVKEPIKANMESIIRAIYTANPDADIVILLTTANNLWNWYGWDNVNQNWHWPQAMAHKEIANEYGLPFIEIGPMLWTWMNTELDANNNGAVRSEYLGDGTHPTEKGYQKYAEFLTAYLAEAFAKTSAKAGTTNSYMPDEPLYNVPVAPYCDTTFSGYESVDAFKMNDSGHLVATEAGTTFNVTFKGSTLKLWNYSNTNSGDISVSVDGGEATTFELYRSELNHKLYTLADGLEAATHTVTITLNTSANHTGSAMEIISFLVAGDADQSGVTISAVAAE